LQEKLGGAFFNREDLRRIEPVLDQIAAVLREYGTGVAPPEDLAPEDAEALFFAPPPTVFDELPPPPPLFETAPEPPPAVREPAAPYEALRSLASRPAEERPPALSRREVLLLKGFVSTLLLEADVAAAVFSFWTDAAAEISISARQPLSAAARDELLHS